MPGLRQRARWEGVAVRTGVGPREGGGASLQFASPIEGEPRSMDEP